MSYIEELSTLLVDAHSSSEGPDGLPASMEVQRIAALLRDHPELFALLFLRLQERVVQIGNTQRRIYYLLLTGLLVGALSTLALIANVIVMLQP